MNVETATAVANAPLVRTGRLGERSLDGEVVLLTGAGGGIGLEAARSLLALGASVLIAEIDGRRCSAAVETLSGEFGPERVLGLAVDVSDPAAVVELVRKADAGFGKVDVVVNNATCAAAGVAVAETKIEDWDRSYAVNLRGPVLLARACLPGMIARRHGAIVCVSSTGGPFLAPYETLKAAQLALANSLDAELEGTGVVAFTIGPGLVPTSTAVSAVERIAPLLGTTVEEFWRANAGAVLSVEAAGAGFAAAVAQADRYAGQEISSTQALIDAGIAIPDAGPAPSATPLLADSKAAAEACGPVLTTLEEQSAGWRRRSFFERQWMMRDFKQRVGVSVEQCIGLLTGLQNRLLADGPPPNLGERATLEKLARFYRHLGELAAGYVKDPAQREEQVKITSGWVAEVEWVLGTFGDGAG